MHIDVTSLPFRLSIGLSIFLFLGIRDWIKNKENPKRAEEYLFITACSIGSIIYAIIHDSITFTISKEYFSIAKDLGQDVQLFPDVVLLATKASYWVGIIIGLVFIILNNPYKEYPQLKYKQLARYLPFPIAIAILFGFIGYFIPTFSSPYFSIGGDGILTDPISFERVAFIHWGTYIGGLVGLIPAGVLIIKQRNS